MAKYNVKFSCGHTEEKQLFGKEAERTRFIAWAEKNGTCSTCRQSEGTAKQILWARLVRAAMTDAVAAQINDKKAIAIATGKLAEYEEARALILQGLYNKLNAKWWIDNRDKSAAHLIQIVFEEIKQ